MVQNVIRAERLVIIFTKECDKTIMPAMNAVGVYAMHNFVS